ncbi:hypothetical protein Salat_1558200 [Sesamum alatum]|uniref:Uncharacterized protein n=1 Tax=Sesamum alatum TaxID=300844 RepID=A0AAE2CMR1_9LAMI|nr:hypothetical protein Salat_1558200 [Sesamum alatum]
MATIGAVATILIEAAGHVNKLVARFFPNLDLPRTDDQGNAYLHVLHQYRQCLINKEFRPKESLTRRTPTIVSLDVPSATELHKVGIGFTVSKTTSIMDISFEHETLSLPEMYLDDSTKSRFLNIIAFEQVHEDATHDFMSYIFFMFRLIQGPNDVSLLQLHGIIDTSLDRDEVARLFNFLIRRYHTTWLSPEHHVVGCKVRSRYKKMSNEWRQDLFQKYLRSPWAVISVVAAILLFILTTIQTVFTVLSFFYRN